MVQWRSALEFIHDRTGLLWLQARHMNLLVWNVFGAVGFRLKPRAVYEGPHDPIATPLLCVGDEALGLHVDVIERFDGWQYEQAAPDARHRHRPRETLSVNDAMGWPLSVTSSAEAAIFNHWLGSVDGA